MVNPFEDTNGTYMVLKNHENQYSLWPSFAAIPAGWSQVFGNDCRTECVKYIEEHWTDMRPSSLVSEKK